MDPISIATTAASLVTMCGKAMMLCNNIAGQQQRIRRTLITLKTEISGYQASLNHIHDLLLDQSGPFAEFLASNETWFESFNTAFTACATTVYILVTELQKVVSDSAGSTLRGILNEQDIKDLTEKLRGQQGAVQVLISSLQMKSTAYIMELLVRESDKLQVLKAQTSALSVKWDVRQFAGDHTSDNFSVFNVDLGSESFAFDDEILGMGPYVRARGSRTQHSYRQQQIIPIGNLLDGDLIDLSNDITSPGKWSSELKQAFTTETLDASAAKEMTAKHESAVESGPEVLIDVSMGERSWNVNEAESSTRCDQEDHTNGKAESIGNEDHESKEELGDKSVHDELRLEDQDPDIDKRLTSVKSTTSVSTLPTKSNLTASSKDNDLKEIGSDSQSQVRPTSPEKSQPTLGKKTSLAETGAQTWRLEAFEAVPESLKTFFKIDLEKMKTTAPLHYAALRDDCEMLKKLVADRGKNANWELTRLYEGLKVIDWAAVGGRGSYASLLFLHHRGENSSSLKSSNTPPHPQSLDQPRYPSLSPLQWAVIYGNFGSTKILIEPTRRYTWQLQLNTSSGDAKLIHWTPLSLAAFFGHHQIVELLLTHDPPGPETYAPSFELPVLHAAVASLQYLMMHSYNSKRDLLEFGELKKLTSNLLEFDGGNSEEASANFERTQKVISLLQQSRRLRKHLQKECPKGYTPLHVACCGTSVLVVEKLLDLSDMLTKASFDLYKLKQLLKGEDINHCDTPLHLAAYWNRLDIVKLLLRKGMDPNAKGHLDRPALHYAAAMGHLDVVKLLVEAGAVVDKCVCSHTPLSLALEREEWDVAEFLLTAGASPDYPKWGKIVHKAVKMKSRAAAVKLLCEKGVEVNICDESGHTPLHVLAGQDADILETLKCLLQHGAKPDVFGVSSLSILVSRGRGSPEVVKCLLNHGANPNGLRRGFDWGFYSRPLHSLAKNDRQWHRLEIIKILLDAGADPSLKDELSVNRNAISLVEGRLGMGFLQFLDEPSVNRDEDEEILRLLKRAKRQVSAKRKGVKLIVPKESAVGHLEEGSTGT